MRISAGKLVAPSRRWPGWRACCGAVVAAGIAFAVWAGPDLAVGQTSSVPSGTDSQLFGITCTTATNCWAVGDYGASSGVHLNEVLHWNGRHWKLIGAPQPATGSPGYNRLLAVTCPRAHNCWAVGFFSTSMGSEVNEILHWDGHAWSLTHAPAPGQLSSLSGVTCLGTRDCWAVGGFKMASNTRVEELHWNGSTWSLEPARGPLGTLTSVSCLSTTQCWASGFYESSTTDLAIAMRWNGRRWGRASVPGFGTFNDLNGVSCRTRGSCWMVGDFQSAGKSRNEALRRTRHGWSRSMTPVVGYSDGLGAVTCSSADCWAVGVFYSASSGSTPQNEVLRRHGGPWRYVPSPTPTVGGSLVAIACPSVTSCWAAGWTGTSMFHNELLHYNGHAWRLS